MINEMCIKLYNKFIKRQPFNKEIVAFELGYKQGQKDLANLLERKLKEKKERLNIDLSNIIKNKIIMED